MSSSQKSVLITGCSAQSIGSSLAYSFAKRNLLVFATARNTKKIDPKLSALPNVEVLTLDPTDLGSINAAIEIVAKKTGGKLDYLVNNAGRGLVSPFLDTDMKDARDLFEINFWGVLQMVQGFKSLLVEARGTVVNVSSIVGVAWNPYESIYNASKAAVTMFSDTLRLELAPLGVKVVAVKAGMVQSGWYANSVPKLQLPADTLYEPVLKNIQDGAEGVANKQSGTNVDVFAEEVCRQVLGGKTGKIWAGAMSTLVWTLDLLPTWVMDLAMKDRSGLKAWTTKSKAA